MTNQEHTDGVSILIEQKWKIAITVVIFFVAVLFIYIILPLLDGIILGIVLAYVARPMKKYFDNYFPAISSYIAITIIVLPILLITVLGIIEILNELIWLVKNYDYAVNVIINFIKSLDLPEFIINKTIDVIVNFTSYILPLIRQIPVGSITKTLAMSIINIMIAIILSFSLLNDGPLLVEKIMDIIPEEVDEFSKQFIEHLDKIYSSIFIGNTYSAIAVGILSLMVFSFFNLSNVLALSALMLIAAIVPLFAGYMIVVPLTIYRYYSYGGKDAFIFFMACLFVIMIPPELLIRPYIIHSQSDIHPMLIIISFIGGGLIGGLAGFFIAPMLLGAIIAAYRTTVNMRNKNNKID